MTEARKARVNWKKLANDMRECRAAMIECGVRDFARQIGLSASTVSRIENRKKCDADTLFHAAHWLGFPLDRYMLKPGKRP